jgi:hypothetical protein
VATVTSGRRTGVCAPGGVGSCSGGGPASSTRSDWSRTLTAALASVPRMTRSDQTTLRRSAMRSASVRSRAACARKPRSTSSGEKGSHCACACANTRVKGRAAALSDGALSM